MKRLFILVLFLSACRTLGTPPEPKGWWIQRDALADLVYDLSPQYDFFGRMVPTEIQLEKYSNCVADLVTKSLEDLNCPMTNCPAPKTHNSNERLSLLGCMEQCHDDNFFTRVAEYCAREI